MSVIDRLRCWRDAWPALSVLHRYLRDPYYRVLEWRYPEGIAVRLAGDVPVRLHPRLLGMRPELYESALSTVLDRHACNGSVVVDVGAHVGLHALRLAQCVGPRGRVIAVEASPANLRLLRTHLGWNACDQVDVVAAVIGDREDDVEFTYRTDPTDPGGFANSLAYDIGGEHAKVCMTTIDKVCAGLAPALIKIDIEGAELLALRGARETLDRAAPVMIVAIHPEPMRQLGTTPSELMALMQASGYSGSHLDGRKAVNPGFEEIVFMKQG